MPLPRWGKVKNYDQPSRETGWVNFLKNRKYLLTNNTTQCIVLLEGRYSIDIQLKRGLLDVCVLAAIKDKDSYGYQIIKDIHPYVEISESTLYPILRRMENAQLLTVRSAEHNGRLRKYYHITPAGLERLEAFRQEWQEMMAIYKFVTREETHHE